MLGCQSKYTDWPSRDAVRHEAASACDPHRWDCKAKQAAPQRCSNKSTSPPLPMMAPTARSGTATVASPCGPFSNTCRVNGVDLLLAGFVHRQLHANYLHCMYSSKGSTLARYTSRLKGSDTE